MSEEKTYGNYVYINGVKHSNIIKAYSYKEALAIQKKRKQNSCRKFEGRLQDWTM